MRNSRFTPRKNTFAFKALSITTKVMIFGVLLSLFLFACVGTDTLTEVAHAAGITSDYNDVTIDTRYKYNVGNIGKNISTYAETTTLIAGDTNPGGNSTVSYGWMHNEKGVDFTTGWYVTFTDSAYWAIKNGCLTIKASIEMQEHYNQNAITASFWHSKGGAQIGSSVTSVKSDIGDTLTVSNVTINNLREVDGIYSFYTQLYFNAHKESIWGLPSYELKAEFINSGAQVKLSSADALAPYVGKDGNNVIKVWDYNNSGTGSGIRSVGVKGPDGKENIYYAPASRNTSTTISSNSTPSSLIGSATYSNNTKDFSCVITKAGTYTVTAYDHIGHGKSETVTFDPFNLLLVDPTNDITYTIEDAVTESGVNLVIPSKLTKDGSVYKIDNNNGLPITDIVVNSGYGISNYTASVNSTIVTNGQLATYKASALGDVTLIVNWKKLFTLIYNDNLSSAGTVTRYADRDNTTTTEIVNSTDYGLLTQKTPAASWNKFIRPGYYLAGWSTSSGENNTKNYDVQSSLDISSYTNNDTVNLYAVWKPLRFVVAYDGNGSTQGTMATTGVMEYNPDSISIPATVGFKRNDTIFDGWLFSATSGIHNVGTDGNLELVNNGTINDILSIRGVLVQAQDNIIENEVVTLTLTAQWQDLEFGLNYATGKDLNNWGTKANPYLIKNYQHLKNLADILSGTIDTIESNDTNGYLGKIFEVAADIDGIDFVTGTSTGQFNGSFDGMSHKITLSISSPTTDYVGLFGYISPNAIIKNLTVAGTVNASGKDYIGGIVAYINGGTVSDCTISNLAVTGDEIVGGIVGCNNGGTIKDCEMNTVTVAGRLKVGGVVGWNYGAQASVSNCDNIATVTASGGRIGGIAGENSGTITGCVNNATVSNGSVDYVGGIVGYNEGTITNCEVNARVSGNYRVGGIAGQNDSTISNCTVSGEVKASQRTGGIVGYNTKTISNCENYATITGGAQLTGGIAGISTSTGTITNCDNFGPVSGTIYNDNSAIVGGIVGQNEGEVTSCNNNATVTADGDFVGGIVGTNGHQDNQDVLLTNCYNNEKITGRSAVGGIVGQNVHGATIEYCVHAGSVEKTYSGDNNIGTISGNTWYSKYHYVFSFDDSYPMVGGDVTRRHDEDIVIGWTFTTNTAKVGNNNIGHYIIDTADIFGDGFANVKPATESGRATNWEDILTTDFTGFYIGGGTTIANGKYLSIMANNSFVAPSDISTIPDNTTGILTIEYIEFGNISGVAGDMVLSLQDMIDTTYGTMTEITTTFDGTDKAAFSIVDIIQGYDVPEVTITKGNDTINASATPIELVAKVTKDGKIYGLKLYKIQINPLDLSGSNIKVFYSGNASGANRVDVDVNGTSTTLYDVTSGSIVDYNDASEGGMFYIAVATADGYRALYSFTYDTSASTTGSAIKVNGFTPNGTISASHVSTYVDANKLGENSTSSFSGSGNYTGNRTITYTLIGSDFGRKTGATGTWGTKGNPYVISHWTHLVRLSEIVNGISEPIDSVYGYGIARDVIAEDIFFSAYDDDGFVGQCYFVVEGTINVPDGIVFVPIGGRYFAEYGQSNHVDADGKLVETSFFGGNIDGTNGNAGALINLGSALDEYTGDYSGLFGLVKGKIIGGNVYNVSFKNVAVNATTISGGSYVGSIIGEAREYVIVEYTATYTNEANVNGVNYVGGLIGKVGLGVQMYGTIENNGQVTATGNYIGGIIGQLVAGAGKKSTSVDERYDFGDGNLVLVNNGKVMAYENTAENGNYVGGIIGGTIMNTGDVSGVETIINPTYMQNFASVAGTNFVGGFIGEVSENVALQLINNLDNSGLDSDNWSHNGSTSSNSDATISATASNVGGLVGKLSTMGHRLSGLFNTMPVSGGEENVGGLVGYMGGGAIDNSFVTTPGTSKISASTSMVQGARNAGGLVGNMQAGSLTTSYSQGFNFGTVSAGRGGVVGTANPVANIVNSWTLYVTGTADSVTHSTISSNTYGKYILTYDGHATATIGELLVFAGLMNTIDDAYIQASKTGNSEAEQVVATKGMISLGLVLPAVGDVLSYETKSQLTFFDASGYETPFPVSFDDAANDKEDAENLFIRLDTRAGSSLIIAATKVHFGTIVDYNEKKAWADAYINIGDEQLYKVIVENGYVYKVNDDGSYVLDSNKNKIIESGADEPITVVNPDGYTGTYYVPVYRVTYNYTAGDGEGNYVATSREITKYYGKNTEVAPLVIGSKPEWDAFAASVQGGTTYSGQYVKLAVDLVGTNRITKESELAGSSAWQKAFWGTFDGDGHTIELDINYTKNENDSDSMHAELGLFRSAQSATFKNLTITGTIKAHKDYETTVGTNHIGAFVGRAHGSLTFENCTSDVNIVARGFSVGGFIGSTKLTTGAQINYTFTGCVNSGDIVTYYPVGEITYEQRENRDSEKYGVGGFIGTVWNGSLNITYNNPIDAGWFGTSGDGEPIYNISGAFSSAPKVIMDSCRNTGDIYGSYNVGGLIGYNGGSTEITNCGNTGTINAVGEGTFSVTKNSDGSLKVDADGELAEVTITPSRESRTYIITDSSNKLSVYVRRYLNAGGLVGLSTTAGHVDMYASYNSGTVHAWGNTAGGLLGSDTEYTKTRQSSNTTKIFYCYNTGEVITGLDDYTVFLGSNKDYTDRYDDSDKLDDQRLMKHYTNTEVMVDDEGHRNQGKINHWEMTLRHETNVEGGKRREGGSFGTTVGGIIGSTTNSDIRYCYNLGTITCRGLAVYTHGSGTPGLSYTEYHARAGGIVGLVDSGSVSVSNSYSVGDIKLEARHATTGSFSLENISFAGLDGGVIKELRQTRPMYVAGIVGHDNANQNVNVTNCFSIKYQCHFRDENNKYFRYHIEGYNPIVTGIIANDQTGEWYGWSQIISNLRAGKIKHAKIAMGTALNSEDENSSSGYVVSSVAQLTAITNTNGIVTMPAGESYTQADKTQLNTGATTTHTVASATKLNPDYANGQGDVRTVRDGMSAIKNGAVGGWVFIPGCLPQLAMFALDTQDGLAMTSYGYGQNTQGEYVKQIAGSEFNPYIIKDGIDLLGLSALVAGANSSGKLVAGINFNGKYIEFANGRNNLAGDVVDAIEFPGYSVNYNTTGHVRDYIFYDSGEQKEGKSYQLYNRAANGLHGVKGSSNQTSQTRTNPATSIRATSQDTSSGAFNTDALDSAYTTWTKMHHGYDGTDKKYKTGVMFDKHNINPIGYTGVVSGNPNFAFMGNISGALPGDKQVEILNLRVSNGYTVNDGSTINNYAGLFGLVVDANISNITAMGEIYAYGGSVASAQAGLVAKAYGKTNLTNLYAGTENNSLTVLTVTGTTGYVGGIVGLADSGASGNRLTVKNCVVKRADVSTHTSGAGGIMGYTQGADATSYTDVIGCTVENAYIHSATGFAIAGVIGNQGSSGAVTVQDCAVGTQGATYVEDKGIPTSGVKIEGNIALGGIISYAFATDTSTNSYINCYVYEDVLIRRIEGGNNVANYGTAIGGIVGGILDDPNGKATFSGFIAFFGTIDLGKTTQENIHTNVGGVVGYMGTSARMEQCVVEIGGTIKVDATGDGENIGGFAGISMGVLLDGVFLIHPSMQVSTSDAVGGFIGYNAGDTHIARTAIIYTTPAEWVDLNGDGLASRDEIIPSTEKVGNIVANDDVGGFIGHNEAGKKIILGVSEYKGTPYGAAGDYAKIVLGSSVDGYGHVGGFIGHNAGIIDGRECQIDNTGHVGGANLLNSNGVVVLDGLNKEMPLCSSGEYIGGVIGYIEQGGEMTLSASTTVTNSGQVGHSNFQVANQSFVGGIIGASFGTITVNGTLSNEGSVYGYEYVGGAIGAVGAGTISGTLNNGSQAEASAFSSSYEGSEALVAADGEKVATSSVTAVRNVGGVIGVVMQSATIDGAIMNNYGTVTADSVKYSLVQGQIVPSMVDGVIQSIIDDETKFVSNLGGVIGLHYGIITGSSEFNNYGHITAENFAGGAIGISDGTIRSASFVNYATITFKGDTALGGSVGYITNGYTSFYPVVDGYQYVAGKNLAIVSNSYFSYEPISRDGYETKVVLQATGATPYQGTAMGGLGGVFGVIDSSNITTDNWMGNTFFINGDVYGGTFTDSTDGIYVEGSTNASRSNFVGTVTNVGGVVGVIKNAYITIDNMLVYKSNVGGKNYVGGIIGSNGSTNTTSGTTASIYNCYNVEGEVWAVDKDGKVGLAGGIVGNIVKTNGNNPLTYASYWVKAYANEHLQNSNPNDIANTLDKAGTWDMFLSYSDFVSNIDIADKAVEDVTEEDLAEAGVTTIEEYLNQTGYLGTADGMFSSWADYVSVIDGEQVLTVGGKSYTQNQIDDWGTYGDVSVNYNTGAEDSSTGYYYIYAEDGSSFAQSDITVDHAGSPTLSTPYDNEELNYWLIIANSPNQDIKEYASNNVYSSVNNGKVVPGVIYASAYTATKNGYYLYVKSTDQNATEMYAQGTKMYVSSDAKTAGNVMIFYKQYTSGTKLEYNGFYRWAPASEDLIYKSTLSNSGTDINNDVPAYGTNYYTLKNTDRANGVNEGKDAGTYDTVADIWTLDSSGALVVLGAVDSRNSAQDVDPKYKWKINPRKVKVEYTSQYDIEVEGFDGQPSQYTGEYSHYVTMTASNIALDEAHAYKGAVAEVVSQIKSMIGVSVTGNNVTESSIYLAEIMTNVDDIAEDPGANYLVVAYYSVGAENNGTVSGDNTIDTNGRLSTSHLFNITYKVYAKKAGTYEVSAVAGENSNHTTQTQGKTKIQIDRRAIAMTFEVEEKSSGSLKDTYEFDGGQVYRGVTKITMTNISPADLRNVGVISDMLRSVLNLGNDNVENVQDGPEFAIDTNNGRVTITIKTSDVGYYNPTLELVGEFAQGYMLPNISSTLSAGTRYQATEEANGVTTWSAEWSITKHTVPVGTVSVASKTVTYNGQTHSVSYTSTGGGGFDDQVKWGNETINVSVNLSMGEGMASAVNVGVYPVDIVEIDGKKFTGSVNRSGSKATAKNPVDNYALEGDVQSEGDVKLTILPREVRINWNGTPASSFVYSGSAQGLSTRDVLFEMKNDSGEWETVGSVAINGNTLTISGLLTHNKPQGGEVSESMSFNISNFTQTDAGNYTATIGETIASVSGKNDAGDAQKGNYTLADTPDGHDYTIAKSIIEVSVTSHNITGKVFDGNSVVYETLPTLTITSTNGGATDCVVLVKNARYHKDGKNVYDVGKGYDFYIDFKFANEADSKNYEIVTDSLVVDANAEITPKGITITLNTSNGATATKVFDNSNIYATVESKGRETVKSTGNEFKPGRGITVEGFITSGVVVTARFQEMGNGRSEFSAYVNDVYLDNNNQYKKASDGTYFKQIYIVLSNAGSDNEMGNYYIAEVRTKSGDTLVQQTSGTTIKVPDSRAENSVTEGKNFKVTITPYSIKAKYGNTAQSYANPDNTYNTNWKAVICSDTKVPDSFGLTSQNLQVVVNNGWMTDNAGNPQKYNKYTRIAGRANNSELGAYLASDKGYEYCFNLRTQPTLIIGYFVEQPDGYGIGTMAGLLIATEYFKGNFTDENSMSYDFVQTVIDVTTIDNLPSGKHFNSWEDLFNEIPDYNISGYVHNGTTYGAANIYKDIQSRMNATSDSVLKEALQTELNSFEIVFEQLDGQSSPSLQYVYWKAEEVVDGTQYKRFYLTNNIDGILTATDMEMLMGAFGDSWGAGKSFLSNVLFAEEGSVVIFKGSVFDYFVDAEGVTHAFDGTFNGMGYTIDHLNITKTITSAGTYNIGMFSEIRDNVDDEVQCLVTAINFRNLSIYVYDGTGANNIINVGAVAGMYAGTAVMQNITVHGTISVRSKAGTVNVGGVIGYDETGYVDGGVSSVLDGAMVVATIRAEGATVVAGGIVGVMSQYKTSLTDLVSLSEIYAKGTNVTANGFVGKYSGLVNSSVEMKDGKDYEPISTNTSGSNVSSAFMDAIFTINTNDVYTRVGGYAQAYSNKYVRTYTELYDGSKTAFDSNGKYTKPRGSDNAANYNNPYGIYDVIDEKDTMAGAHTTGSMRLKDIVDIYVLGYGLTKTTAIVDGATLDTVKKEATSKYFHAIAGAANNDGYKPDGTADNPIKIAYQQHLSLIRMFNYMNFELVGDIKMYTGYNLAVVDEAFTGTFESNGYTVNFRNGTEGIMFAYQTNNGADTDTTEKSITYDWVIVDPQDEE